MSTTYNKTTWQDGDIITADKMNNIENGVKGIEQDVSDLKDDLQAVQTEVAATLITDTASGSIASFPDGADNVPVKSLTVAVEPVQDLHGQDAPYPAGGGKNLLDFRTKAAGNDNGITYTNNNGVITANGTASGYSYYQSPTFTLSAGTYIANGRPSGSNCALTIYNATTSSGIANPSAGGSQTFTLSEATPIYARILIGSGTASNEIFKPMIRLSSVTDGTFAPYENICPISGHTQAKVTRTGVNLYPPTGLVSTGNCPYFPLKAGTYCISSDNGNAISSTTAVYIRLFDKDGFNITSGKISSDDFYLAGSGATYYSAVTKSSFVFTLLEDCQNCKVGFDNTLPTNINAIQIEYGNTASDYKTYTAQTVTIDLDGTRYGGTLNATTGVLTVDRAVATLNGSESWSTNSATTGLYYLTISGIKNATGHIISNMFKETTVSGVNMVVGEMKFVSPNIVNFKTSYATLAEWKTALASNNVQLLYKLAEPFEVTLTGQDITTLLGQNNIWNDCGDTTVEYRADTKLYIEKLTAPTEDDMIADHAISANTFFMVGNTLYRATTAIASGATITVGTNATRLSLADALNTLS